VQRDEIIELANQLSERKGERVLNLQTLYRFVVQDICKRQRFWWRRVQVTFNLTIGTPTYDLTDITLFPDLFEIALDEITKFTLITSPNPLQVAELVPVFDPETLIEMKNNVSTQQPGRYTMDAGDYKVLRVDMPDAAYQAYIVGWGMANPGSDTFTTKVPLIPTWGHNTIVMGIVAKVFKFAYGSENPKTMDAIAEYEQGLQDLMQRKQFDPNYKLQMSLNESAVRST
jgi:hypothetical protein